MMQESEGTLAAERYNRRLGLVLFAVYLAFYAGFVAVTAVSFRLMGTVVAGGLNIAIVYGAGLIVGAFAVALMFMWMARKDPAADQVAGEEPEGLI